MITRINRPKGHAEILKILRESSSEAKDEEVLEYLHEIASSYTADEAFAVIALVDTPDVFD